jgi:hypothetical protein
MILVLLFPHLSSGYVKINNGQEFWFWTMEGFILLVTLKAFKQKNISQIQQ